MAQEVLWSISLIIGIAALITVIARAIRQPPIIAYLIAGVIVGPIFLNLIGPSSATSEIIQTFAHIGVAFLLFIVGLSLDFRVLKEIGGVASIVGLTEIVITGTISGLIALGLGFSSTTSIYIATALAFSSTVVVVKILSDKKEIDTLHGRIVLGILIVEDFIAAIALMVVPLIEQGGSMGIILNKLLLILVLIAGIFLGTALVFNRFLDYLSRNQEVLFLFGVGWALLLASLFDYLGFSLEIGALIAGMSLASTKYTLELSGKMKPLRDFFIVLFFVFFGSQLAGVITMDLIKNALIFSVFILIGKPLIVMSLLRSFGYKKRTNFLAGSSLAQISEFSLILILMGFSLGHITQDMMNLVILISIFTIGASSYSIYYARSIFNQIGHLLNLFEGKRHKSLSEPKENYEIILFGYHRMGYKVLSTLQKMKVPFVVVDHNPKVILALNKWGINCVYGDAGDKGFLSQLEWDKVKLTISTIPDNESNVVIKKFLLDIKSKATFIATAEQPRFALELYELGADYVLIPHHLGGDYASHIITSFGLSKQKYKELGIKHLKELKKGKDKSEYF